MKRENLTIEEIKFNKWRYHETVWDLVNDAIKLCDKVLNSNNTNGKESKEQDRKLSKHKK